MTESHTPARPNVLCIVTDQQRHDHLGCAGNPIIQTPNLDRLAAGGVRFDRAYVNHPICMPSRATMWTGQTSIAHQLRANGMALDPRWPTVPGALAAAGYRTHGVGKFHLSPIAALAGADPLTLNPQEWPESKPLWRMGRIGALPTPYYGLQSTQFIGGHGDFIWGDYRHWLMRVAPDVVRRLEAQHAERGREDWLSTEPSILHDEVHHSRWVADRVIEFLHEPRHTGQPFFCWCSFPDPHHPYHAPEPYHSLYDRRDMPQPVRRDGELDNLPPFYRRLQTESICFEGLCGPMSRFDGRDADIMACTYGMVSNIDTHIGRILDALEALGLRENTVVVFLSDHGDMMGDHWLHLKGPFHFDGLIRVPFIWNWPGHIPAGVVHTGIASLLDLAPTLLDLCGVPIPEGPRPVKPFLPNELPPWPGHSLRPILEGQPTPVRDTALLTHDDDTQGTRARTLVTERYRLTCYGGQPWGELFDLQEDPAELYNLWDDPARRGLRYELTAQLLDELIMADSRLPRRQTGA